MSRLAIETEAYQAQLEANRRVDPDDLEAVEQSAEDLGKARRAMEVAWLEERVA